jgi:hypothetical protein
MDISYTCCKQLSLKDYLSHIGKILSYFSKLKYLNQKYFLSYMEKT